MNENLSTIMQAERVNPWLNPNLTGEQPNDLANERQGARVLLVQLRDSGLPDLTGRVSGAGRGQHVDEFEAVLLNVLARFVNLPAGESEREIGQALRRICACLAIDRGQLWYKSPEDADSFSLAQHCLAGESSIGFSWTNGDSQLTLGWPPPALTVAEIPLGTESVASFPWITAQAKRGKTVMFSRLEELPAEARRDKEALAGFGTRSSVVIPLLVQNKVLGAVSFDIVQGQRVWTELILRRMELVAEVFADATARKLADEALWVEIAERKKVESVLRESEARFRAVADSAPVMIWMSGPDKLCNFFNKSWLDFTGRTMEQETGNGWAEGVHPGDLPACLQIYVTSFDARRPFAMQYRLKRQDGQYRWISDTGVPRYEADGNFVGYIGSCVDVTEQMLAEEALAKSYAQIKQLKDHLQVESDYLKSEIKLSHAHGQIIGRSEGIKRVLHQAEQVAPADCPVLVSGETGTGKELIAQEIHRLSRRRERLMVLVNCAALPSALVESELFGRERGAYTGALTSQVGRFEVADKSTMFLDEVGELSLEVQAKLLRVLQQGEFQRLGSPKTHKVDVRVIAATNRDLAAEVRKGKFREDLYYRLNVFPIQIPPLRERVGDIALLVFAFLEEFANRMGKKITKVPRKAMEALQEHSWPGNIRELRNVIEHSVILSTGDTLKLSFLGDSRTRDAQPVTLAEAERGHILKTLESTGWRIKGPYGAALRLDLQPSTLYSRMRKLGIPHRRQKDDMPNGSPAATPQLLRV